jgi:hypothetical protein
MLPFYEVETDRIAAREIARYAGCQWVGLFVWLEMPRAWHYDFRLYWRDSEVCALADGDVVIGLDVWSARYSLAEMRRWHGLAALAETKARNETIAVLDGWGGIWVDRHKWVAIEVAARRQNAPLIFLPRAAGVHWFHETSSFEHDGPDIGNRPDRPDRVPTILLRQYRFLSVDLVLPTCTS